MRATDDATEAPRHFHRSFPSAALATLALALLTGAAIGATFALVTAPRHEALFEARLPWTADAPTRSEWPREPRAGESARVVTSGTHLTLVVRAARAPIVRELAAAIAHRRATAVDALVGARAQARARWLSSRRAQPLPLLSTVAERASLLLAAAQRDRDLALCLPAPYAGPAIAAPLPPPALRTALENVARSAEDGDAATLTRALQSAAAAEDAWFAAGVPARGADAATRGAAWRAYTLARAEALEALGTQALAAETPFQQALAPVAALDAVSALDAALPPAYQPLVDAAPLPALPSAVPMADAWLRLLGLGALLGALGAGLAAAIGLLTRGGVGHRPALSFTPAREPGASGPWLHLVAGPNATAVARATLELAAHALAHGERVLVVDGGSRLMLHERFGREARWGLMECLLADMPVLGLVQYGGRPGFYLLAHGNAARGEGWASLGQRLDDARPHFGRIVLALDSGAPRAIGDALLGRALEGWWAERVERLPRAAVELTARLGIAFSGLDLDAIPEVQLELLSARVEVLRGLLPVAALQPAATLVVPPAVRVAAPVLEPVVLDCDLQVRQRLRFLAWMRRVQSESRPVEA